MMQGPRFLSEGKMVNSLLAWDFCSRCRWCQGTLELALLFLNCGSIVCKKYETHARNLSGIWQEFGPAAVPSWSKERVVLDRSLRLWHGKEHMCIDVSSKVDRALLEFYGARGKLWLNTEI